MVVRYRGFYTVFAEFSNDTYQGNSLTPLERNQRQQVKNRRFFTGAFEYCAALPPLRTGLVLNKERRFTIGYDNLGIGRFAEFLERIYTAHF